MCHSTLKEFRIFIKVFLFSVLQVDLNNFLCFQSRYVKFQFKCEFHLCEAVCQNNNKIKIVAATCFPALIGVFKNISSMNLPMWDQLRQVWMWGTVPERKFDPQESQFPFQLCTYGGKKDLQFVEACCCTNLVNSAIWMRIQSLAYVLRGGKRCRPVGKHMVQSTVFALPPVLKTQSDICNMNQEVRRALDFTVLQFH